uniref:Uncharacterized protein n=1 Tax=Caudovirales sp. ctEpl1 TaxID=2826770 RepID=A0A8S5NRV4_9CAUD|nr:MAG TPA: hypothetical protein [Caudovirales sp. ctEpl1]
MDEENTFNKPLEKLHTIKDYIIHRSHNTV